MRHEQWRTFTVLLMGFNPGAWSAWDYFDHITRFALVLGRSAVRNSRTAYGRGNAVIFDLDTEA